MPSAPPPQSTMKAALGLELGGRDGEDVLRRRLQVGVTGVDHALTNVGLARKVVCSGVVADLSCEWASDEDPSASFQASGRTGVSAWKATGERRR